MDSARSRVTIAPPSSQLLSSRGRIFASPLLYTLNLVSFYSKSKEDRGRSSLDLEHFLSQVPNCLEAPSVRL